MCRIDVVVLKPVQYGNFGHQLEEALADAQAYEKAVYMIESHNEKFETFLPEAFEEFYIEESRGHI